MLRELRGVRQDPNERYRRWFEDEYFDLIVWYEGTGVYGFQLCYDTQGRERALTWIRGKGFSHNRVDTGERAVGRSGTPILVQDGLFDKSLISGKFKAAAAGIDPAVVELVYGALQRFPDDVQGREP